MILERSHLRQLCNGFCLRQRADIFRVKEAADRCKCQFTIVAVHITVADLIFFRTVYIYRVDPLRGAGIALQGAHALNSLQQTRIQRVDQLLRNRCAVELLKHGNSGVLHDDGRITDVGNDLILCLIRGLQILLFHILIDQQKNQRNEKQAKSQNDA